MGHALAPRRVLVVARWYPSYDDPGRGSFVADHVRALVDAGTGVTVASFEPAMLRGEPATRPAIGRLAAERWRAAVARQEALNVPGSDGPPGIRGVRVARLPVVLEPGERPAEVEVDAHADPLLAFGTALAAREGIDLVHAHTAVPDGLAAARLADALGVPLVVTEHASLVREQLTDPATAAMVATLAGPGRRLTAVSDHLARLIEAGAGLAAGSVGVVPNVVPAALFAPAAAPRGAPDEPGPTTLLWVGARKASKGTDTLLRAFALALRERPDLRLRLVGRAPTDEEEQRLRALASDLGVAAAVAFDPPLPRAGVAQAMRGATLLVHPSPFETFGMVVAEALLVGLPVAATPSGVEAILGTDGATGSATSTRRPCATASSAGAARRACSRRRSTRTRQRRQGSRRARHAPWPRRRSGRRARPHPRSRPCRSPSGRAPSSCA
ncbi:MAG: glycosyltransferase [Chloroflexi bacterium]|nr:glycosyltransferase [Chloroflexota bacterium]